MSASSSWPPTRAQPSAVAVVEVVGELRVRAELEQLNDGLALPRLGGEVERGDALAVARPAERTAAVWVGTEPDQRSHRVDPAVDRGPRQRGAPVRVGVDARAELDEQLDRLDAVGLRRPHERLVEHLLRVVGGLPRGKATVRAVEAAVCAGLCVILPGRGRTRHRRAPQRREGCRARARAGRRPRDGPRTAP